MYSPRTLEAAERFLRKRALPKKPHNSMKRSESDPLIRKSNNNNVEYITRQGALPQKKPHNPINRSISAPLIRQPNPYADILKILNSEKPDTINSLLRCILKFKIFFEKTKEAMQFPSSGNQKNNLSFELLPEIDDEDLLHKSLKICQLLSGPDNSNACLNLEFKILFEKTKEAMQFPSSGNQKNKRLHNLPVLERYEEDLLYDALKICQLLNDPYSCNSHLILNVKTDGKIVLRLPTIDNEEKLRLAQEITKKFNMLDNIEKATLARREGTIRKSYTWPSLPPIKEENEEKTAPEDCGR